MGTDAGERVGHAFKLADRQAELLADAHPGGSGPGGVFGVAHRLRGQRNAAADRQAFHQHPPALSGIIAPADNPFQREENVFAPYRPVPKRRAVRVVTALVVQAFDGGRQQCAGDADVGFVAQQAFGVAQFERQTDYGGNRRHGDPAFFKAHPYAQYVFMARAVARVGIAAVADDAGIGNRAGVGTRPRAGEGETGHIDAFGQPRQVVVFLLGGAVVLNQFGRPQRVGQHNHIGRGRAAAGDFAGDFGVGVMGKGQAAVFFLDNHRDKAFVFHVLPHFGRQVFIVLAEAPVV